jgi:hypothetical protein
LCCYVRSDILTDLYVSKYNRHPLQNFELNVSSHLYWSSVQAVPILLSVLGNKFQHVMDLKMKYDILR